MFMKKHTKKNTVLNAYSIISEILLIVSSIILFLVVYSMKILPDKYLHIVIAVLVLFSLFFSIFAFSKEIEQRRQEQQQEMELLQAAPEEQLTTEQQLFRRLCTLMDEQQPYTDETLNRDMLASLLGTNVKYVEQAIRQCSKGETVSDFINRYRLEHVTRLLKTTDDPIAIIGELSGIPSRATLARLFRNAYGMTPSEYRKI